MTLMTDHRSDTAVRDDVEKELAWTPQIVAAHIGVAADDGVVTLTGRVPTYANRIDAVKAAQRVRGVAAVADEMTVEIPGRRPSDGDIAAAVDAAFDASPGVPSDCITIEVRNGTVILTGEVDWHHERAAARHALEHVAGVVFVDNRLALRKRPTATDTAERIRNALVRRATVDAKRIAVHVDGTEVTLTGQVSNSDERIAAARAAWASPSVTEVRNELTIVSR